MKKFHLYILFAALSVGLFFVLRKPEITDKPQFGKDRPDGFAEFKRIITGSPNGNSKGYRTHYKLQEFYKAINRFPNLKSSKVKLNWVERGPGNVGGRTRALIVDPTDPSNNTWIAGSVSGGIWKTTDAGSSWQKLTDDIPVLSTSTLAMAPSDPDIIYAGTGEGFGGYGMVVGNGIFKSAQHGDPGSWELLESTKFNENFEYVNRIIVDYDSSNIVLTCTNTGIYKSVDGGENWYNVYEKSGRRVQDIVSDPRDFNVLYAGVNTWGVIKSTDKGETWSDVITGIGEGKRYELVISSVNPDRVFASVEGYNNQSIVYISSNAGESWNRLLEKDGNSFNFLRGQGWFDNVIACDPFDEDVVFIGGVYLGKVEFLNTTEESDPLVLRVDTFATGAMLDFFSFGGRYFNGSLAVGSDEDAEELEEEDWRSVEIRIGSNYSQKAHRFTVPQGSGAGVPAEKYSYADYIDVPFEVWDTDNNEQLMVSFRDNEQDGGFDVLEFNSDLPAKGREYIFVHGIPYNETKPVESLTLDGGYLYKLLYFMWPTLQPDSIWDINKLDGKIRIKYGKYTYQKGIATMLADDNKNRDLHVDHHQIIPIITNQDNKQFTLLNSNDGGIGISKDGGNTWNQITKGYNTTQFYGVAKKPGTNEYIGGMQDNGTWQSKIGEAAKNNTEYFDRLEGDGFETLWHPDYPQRIIGSTYNNYFSITNNGGEDWDYTYEGIYGDGPFVSRLAHSLERPNVVFAVGGRGVYRHYNFGLGKQRWELIDMPNSYSYENGAYSHDVEVSLANKDIVWAGTAMYSDPKLSICVSTDGGDNFEATNNYTSERLGFITSIASHPSLDSTAFVLFSVPEKPKILRTDNLGDTWYDISGFGSNDTSGNGFPDVIVYTLLVHPDDTSVLWAGTEIGLFESVNSGATWAYADNGLPAVSVFQLKVIENQVLVATHGRGIWTLDLGTVGINNLSTTKNISVYPNPVKDMLNVDLKALSGNATIEIYSIQGTLVKRIISRQKVCKIDVSGLDNGSYILKVHSGNLIESARFVKH